MLVNSPSDLFDFVATTDNVSGEGGEERTAMEDEDGEREGQWERRHRTPSSLTLSQWLKSNSC